MKSTMLLAGGHGFIGTHVYNRLMQKGMRKEMIVIPDRAENDLRDMKNCSELKKIPI
ncbi:MAG: NAD-dependent epimerase/dehydratase family protein [Candidatus Xenobiia bacterium LiM19]